MENRFITNVKGMCIAKGIDYLSENWGEEIYKKARRILVPRKRVKIAKRKLLYTCNGKHFKKVRK